MIRLLARFTLYFLCAITLSCARSTFVDDKEVVVTRLVDVALRLEFEGANELSSAATNQSGWLATKVQGIGAATKGGANVLEQQVNDLNIFFVRERHESSPDAGSVRHIYLTAVDLKDSIVLKDVYLGKHIMYMIGNAGDLSKGGTVHYTAKMLSDFAFDIDGLGLANTHADWALRGLPMFSREVVDIKFEGDGVKPIGGRLRFGVAKVNFNCKIDTVLSDKIIYISSVALVNTAKMYAPFNNSAPSVEVNNRLYLTSYNDSDNKRDISEWHYVFPNMAGSNDAITDPKDRTVDNAPASATYIYLRATYINSSTGNKEVYGFFVYLGDQDIFSNFDTRFGNEYNLTVNIKGINPDNDPRISSLKVLGSAWSAASVKLGDLITIEVTVKAQNLRGQDIMLRASANPLPSLADQEGMCTLDLRNIGMPDDVVKSALYPFSLNMRPLVTVASDSFEQRYIIGFRPHINVGNYPLKVSVSTASGADTDMDTPILTIVN